MYKNASKNMQRIGLKVTAGTARALTDEIKQPPVVEQYRRMEQVALARVRHCFELETEIARRILRGENVAVLREQLDNVKTGRVAAPIRLGREPTPKSPPELMVVPGPRGDRPTHRPSKPRTLREMAADLTDIAKGKLTLTGASVVKGLLERFDAEFVGSVLKPPKGFIEKVTLSPIFQHAASLGEIDRMRLVEALEAKGGTA